MTEKTPGRRARCHAHSVVLQVLLMLSISVLAIVVYDQYRYQRIVTVDVEAIMQARMDMLKNEIQSEVPNDEILRRSRQWADRLAEEVAMIAHQHNAIVFVRPAVVEGSIDMTSQVLGRMQ